MALPVFCKALDSSSIPSSAHFNLLPSHFIASQGPGLFSAISSPLILLSPLWAALGLPPFLPLFHPGQPPACLAWGGRRAPGTPPPAISYVSRCAFSSLAWVTTSPRHRAWQGLLRGLTSASSWHAGFGCSGEDLHPLPWSLPEEHECFLK